MGAATKLNPLQHHLLNLFSKNMGEEELSEIKALLIKYYQEKIEQELDVFWEKKQHNTANFKAVTTDLHLKS